MLVGIRLQPSTAGLSRQIGASSERMTIAGAVQHGQRHALEVALCSRSYLQLYSDSRWLAYWQLCPPRQQLPKGAAALPHGTSGVDSVLLVPARVASLRIVSLRSSVCG